jgi:hypothetical protein
MAGQFTGFWEFLRAVAVHLNTLLTGCVILFVVGLLEKYLLKRPISWKWEAVILTCFVLFACFQAWRDQYERANTLRGKISSIPSPPVQVTVQNTVPPARVIIQPPAKPTTMDIRESPCSNPIPFSQERFRPTSPPYQPGFIYGSRATLVLNGVKGQLCRIRVFADSTIESMDIRGVSSYTASGSGRMRNLEMACPAQLHLTLLGTSPTKFVCVDAIK